MQRHVNTTRTNERADPRARASGKNGEPRGPDPRSSRKSTVSARSSAWCAVASSVAPLSRCAAFERACSAPPARAPGGYRPARPRRANERTGRPSDPHAPRGEVELGTGLGSKAVVHTVGRDGRNRASARNANEHVEQRHRIGATRNRGENAIAALRPGTLRAAFCVASVINVGGCERATSATRSRAEGPGEFELFAEFEVTPRAKVNVRVRRGRVAIAAELVHGLEVRAVSTTEAKGEGTRLLAEWLVNRESSLKRLRGLAALVEEAEVALHFGSARSRARRCRPDCADRRRTALKFASVRRSPAWSSYGSPL